VEVGFVTIEQNDDLRIEGVDLAGDFGTDGAPGARDQNPA
jgi:hypothetical protein